jgi:N-acyl-D-amino-acid deacylase
LIYLGKVVKEHDSILVAHIRDEQEGLFRALEEMIAVGRESGCRIHISHLKCSGRENWGRMAKVLEVLENALVQGVDISFDQYPYEASCTVLSVLLPGWALEGGWEKLRKRLSDMESRKEILVALEKSIEGRGGPAAIVIASVRSSKNQPLVGKTLEQIARERGIPFDEMALSILVEEKLQAVAIYHSMSKDDVECAMMHFLHTVGSDGILSDFPHPRAYGTFPRIIAHFCRDRGLFSLEKAIQRMTSAPAKRLRLAGRGKIEAGAHADLVIFDPDKFRDNASYNDPQKNASGLDWLFVNARAVLKEGEIKDTRPGMIIVRKGP